MIPFVAAGPHLPTLVYGLELQTTPTGYILAPGVAAFDRGQGKYYKNDAPVRLTWPSDDFHPLLRDFYVVLKTNWSEQTIRVVLLENPTWDRLDDVLLWSIHQGRVFDHRVMMKYEAYERVLEVMLERIQRTPEETDHA